MPNDTIPKCPRIVLRKACPYLSRTDALVYTLHPARHVLREIGKARGEEPEARIELGCWQHSTAARDQCPAAAHSLQRALCLSSLPDRYASQAHVIRVCDIYKRQWSAVRSWALQRQSSRSPLPDVAGWDELDQWNPAYEPP